MWYAIRTQHTNLRILYFFFLKCSSVHYYWHCGVVAWHACLCVATKAWQVSPRLTHLLQGKCGGMREVHVWDVQQLQISALGRKSWLATLRQIIYTARLAYDYLKFSPVHPNSDGKRQQFILGPNEIMSAFVSVSCYMPSHKKPSWRWWKVVDARSLRSYKWK